MHSIPSPFVSRLRRRKPQERPADLRQVAETRLDVRKTLESKEIRGMCRNGRMAFVREGVLLLVGFSDCCTAPCCPHIVGCFSKSNKSPLNWFLFLWIPCRCEPKRGSTDLENIPVEQTMPKRHTPSSQKGGWAVFLVPELSPPVCKKVVDIHLVNDVRRTQSDSTPQSNHNPAGQRIPSILPTKTGRWKGSKNLNLSS